MPTATPPAGWDALLLGETRGKLESEALPAFLKSQRWFAGKSRAIRSARIADTLEIGGDPSIRLAFLEVEYEQKPTDLYFVPMGLAQGAEAERIAGENPGRVVGRFEGAGLLFDALVEPAVTSALLDMIARDRSMSTTSQATFRAFPTLAFASVRGQVDGPLVAKDGRFESSNSVIIYGDRLILKVFRRLEPGINPDFEIGKFLAERTGFDRVPRCAGGMVYEGVGAEPRMVGILQGLVPNQGSGWKYALGLLERYYEVVSGSSIVPPVDLEGTSWVELAAMEVPPELAAVMGEALDAARLLGQRTGELHLAFASDATDPAFAPEPITPGDLERLAEAIGDQVRRALATLRVERDRLPLDVQVEADRALAAEPIFLERLQALANLEPGSTRIRCHGDYHLGQVLRAGGDFVLLDFEGEPAKTLAERVAKQPPLKDVVGMIRSFDYAAFAALFKYLETRPESRETLIPSARAWRTWTAAAFLRRYFETTAEASFLPANPDDVRTLLDALLLDKSLYELLYELNNRPDWVRIPLQGIVALAEERPDGQGERSLTDFDIHLLAEGRHYRAFEKLGAHPTEQAGVPGVQFAVWAPGAKSVAVVGEWNDWNPRAHPMRARGQSGYWERFISDVPLGSCYKYAITSRFGDYRIDKADPYAFASEVRPGTASVVVDLSDYAWNDHNWCDHRDDSNQLQAPISIYEVHLGSWMRHEDGRWLSYREVAPRLAAYVQEMGFTHVELMPLAEHPFDGSWGYQVTAYFAATSRFGTPQDLMYLVDTLHQAEIGVILDWVPAHFPDDAHGLSFFDGTHLYEHPDKRRGFHQDWNTFIFNFGRPEVANFLVSSALFWLETYHLDGLRVDAVASMLYLDYSRKPGQWLPNDQGGRENFEAIALLRLFNEQVHAQFPDVLTIAEESTSWPMVTRPTSVGGLGFDLKWDLGWMHDTLEYLSRDPIERKHHHGQLTFRGIYAFSENFVLPLSHDEVVYGKRSLLAKMPGNTWQKFANLRLLLGYQYALPGKKLMFMGDELGTWVEWNHDAQLDWSLLEFPAHAGLKRWVRDLNDLYRDTPELHELDVNPDGFQWVVTEDSEQSVIAFTRKGDSPSATILIIVNFTPVPRHNYRIGVEQAGEWGEILNSDATIYGGSGQGNLGGAVTSPVSSHGHPRSLNLTLPPLALVMLRSP